MGEAAGRVAVIAAIVVIPIGVQGVLSAAPVRRLLALALGSRSRVRPGDVDVEMVRLRGRDGQAPVRALGGVVVPVLAVLAVHARVVVVRGPAGEGRGVGGGVHGGGVGEAALALGEGVRAVAVVRALEEAAFVAELVKINSI